jgi:hypothetical protein
VRIGVPLSRVKEAPIATPGPNLLVIRLGEGYNWVADECEIPEVLLRIEQELRKLLGRPVTLRFERIRDEGDDGSTRPGAPVGPAPSPDAGTRRPAALEGDPMVQKVVQLFDARHVHTEVDEGPGTPG